MKLLAGDEYLRGISGEAAKPSRPKPAPPGGPDSRMSWHLPLMLVFVLLLSLLLLTATAAEPLAGLLLFLDPTVFNYL